MPDDTYTLIVSDFGTSTPTNHVSTHLDGGSDPLPIATVSSAGLMSAAQVNAIAANTAKVSNVTHTGDVTGATVLTIAANSVTSGKILDGAVIADKLAVGSVISGKILDGAVTVNKLATDSVISGKILDGAVTIAKLAPDVVAQLDTPDESIVESKLATDSVTSIKILDGAVTLPKITTVAANTVLGNATGITASPTAVTCTDVGFDLLSQPTVEDTKTYLGVPSLASVDTISFITTGQTTDTLTEGELRWNGNDRTLDLKVAGDTTIQVGQELTIRVYANEVIANGDVVYISGSAGLLPSVTIASADSDLARKAIGVATENIASGQYGYITLYGLVRDLDTNAYLNGTELWLSINGQLTDVEPSYPNYKVRMGYVVNSDALVGSIYVYPKYFENGSVNGTGKIGYTDGAGGSVTQQPTSGKQTAVTLNKATGQITMDDASLAGGASVSFVIYNDKIEEGMSLS
jgi:hypothetical protein